MTISIAAWADGVIPWVGVKAMIEEFQVDMHQRDEELVVPDLSSSGSTKLTHHKPFYVAEVMLKHLELRAMLATFVERLRQDVQMIAPTQRSNYRAHHNLSPTESSSAWHDADDFIEIDWSPLDNPVLYLLPVVTCPQFAYFKRNSAVFGNTTGASKFGVENSHACLLGKEPCMYAFNHLSDCNSTTPTAVLQVQTSLVSNRIQELKQTMRRESNKNSVS